MMDQADLAAARQVFPDIPRKAYKGIFGYTGKANNLLDLISAILDPSIPAGAKVVLLGAGIEYGLGYIACRKGPTDGD
jgi:hypothetical protein